MDPSAFVSGRAKNPWKQHNRDRHGHTTEASHPTAIASSTRINVKNNQIKRTKTTPPSVSIPFLFIHLCLFALALHVDGLSSISSAPL